MEVWILLAAAGSGYLARRWQNAQKPKESSADEAEDDGGAGPSQNMPSSRGRYRHFSSSGKHQVGKSICGKGSPYWARPKSTGNLVEYRAGNKVTGGEGDKKSIIEGHTCNDANGCQICSDSRDANNARDGSVVQLDSNEHEPTVPDEGPSGSLSRKCLSRSGASNLQTGKQDRHGLERDLKEEYGKGQPSGVSSHPLLFRSMSGKRANDSVDSKTGRGGQMPQDGCAGKRMKDALDSSSTADQNEGCVFGSWMPGFWDVSKGVFVLDTESLLVQPGESSRGSSSRKSRTPNKYGRSKGCRKKSLAGQKPMSSLESCLSAQLDEDYIRSQFTGRRQIDDEVLRDSVRRSSRYSALLASEVKASLSKTDFAIGLPSLSRLPSCKQFPSKSSTPRFSSDGKAMNEEPFNPFACRRYKSASGAKGASKKGRAGSAIKGLLFNFGVGVGMMFTVMSNMREVRRLTLLLKEAESLIKDLEDELEGKDELKSDLGTMNHGAMLEQRQIFVNNTLKKVKSATESLCSMQMILSNEPAASSRIEHVPSTDMSKLERELEAELERMELSLGDGDDPKLQSMGSSECGEVENLVQGELTILGLPHESEVDSDEDSSSSSHEDLHVRNYAVSPRALAKRLHEVLKARQEERISELEAELKTLNSKLQAKEEEVIWLKDNSRGVHAAGVSEAVDCKVHESPPSRSHQKQSGFLNRAKDTSQLKILRSPNPSPISPHIVRNVFNDVSVFKKGIEDKTTAFITLGGEALEAYKEACDEFSKLSTCGSDGTLIPESRHSDRHGKETYTQEGKVDAKHLGSSDGWEQVDLLSLAEDFYGGDDPDMLENMPSWSKTSFKERRDPRRKSRIKGHPEPEPFSNSRGIDSSDDATNDTSGSTPCSIKFMDVRTVACSQNDDKQAGTKEGDCDWSREILICAGVNTPNQEEYDSIHSAVEKSSFPSSRQGVCNFSDDSDHYSELDEQLGQLLIKRIVEKSKRGSPIVQDAQTVLAHLEKDERVQTSE